jgi:hypothetical protein
MMTLINTALRQLCRFSVHCVLISFVFAVAAHAADAGELTVKAFAGAVKLKMDERWQDPQVGMTVRIPATVSTGADGSIDFLQDGTTFSVAANTALELLPGPASGAIVKRVVQSKGSAFYDVAKQEGDKLRVETPYLVAVIKGTQFNVTVATESASVALFEGRLQIDAPDVGDSIELEAGHIARRARGESRITVLSMEDGEPLARDGTGAAEGSDNGATPAGDDADENGLVADDSGNGVFDNGGPGASEGVLPVMDSGDAGASGGQAGGPLGVAPGLAGVIGEAAAPLPGLGGSLVDVSNELTIGSDGLDLGAAAGIDAGALEVAADIGAAIDVAGGQLDADIGVDVGLADAGLDVGVGADVGLGSGDIGLDVDAGVDVADVGVDAGVAADVGLGDGDIGLGLDAGVGVGDVGVGIDVDTGLDGGGAGLDVDLDLEGLDDVTDVLDGLLGGEDDPVTEEEEEDEDEGPAPLLPDLGDLLGL